MNLTSTQKMNQIWLEVSQQSKNNLGSHIILQTHKYGHFSLLFFKCVNFCTFFTNNFLCTPHIKFPSTMVQKFDPKNIGCITCEQIPEVGRQREKKVWRTGPEVRLDDTRGFTVAFGHGHPLVCFNPLMDDCHFN